MYRNELKYKPVEKTRKTRKKLSELLAHWPKGMVATHPWLKKQGVSRFLTNAYHRSGWVRRIGRGAYARLDDQVEWPGALHAVQFQLNVPVYVGGKTALEWQGYAHFMPMGKGGKVRLYAPHGTRLPAWFLKQDWGVKLIYRTPNLFLGESKIGLTEKQEDDYSLRLSAPERAILELLDEVPFAQSFEESRLLMEGLNTLRPSLVQMLLEACRSIKVKRLFLFFAEEQGHAWVKELNLAQMNLGSGKRAIVKGGHLDPKYRITVLPRPDILPKDAP